MRWIYYNKIA